MQKDITSDFVPSLPPNVTGFIRELFQINGKITFPSVILRKKQSTLSLKLSWWGEKSSATSSVDENNSFRFEYQVNTSRILLEKYLKSCEEVEIFLFSSNSEIGSTRLKTKDISLNKVHPRIYTIVNKNFRVIAKIKVDFRMLGVCSRVVDYKSPSSQEDGYFRLRVDYLKIRQAYKFPSLVTTDFKVVCSVNAMEFECKTNRLCDDSMGLY